MGLLSRFQKERPQGIPGDDGEGETNHLATPAIKDDPGVYKNVPGFDSSAFDKAVEILNKLGTGAEATATARGMLKYEQQSQEELKGRMDEIKNWAKEIDQAIRGQKSQQRQLTDAKRKEQEQIVAHYRDQLARSREDDFRGAVAEAKEADRKLQDELANKAEAHRRGTLEYEAELREKVDLEAVKARTDGQIRAARQNRDIRLEQLRQSASEGRKTFLEGIALASQKIGSGVSEFLSNPSEMKAAVFTISAAALGIYTARTGTGIAGRFIEARLGKPSLVRDTSRRSFVDFIRNPLGAFGGLNRLFSGAKVQDALEGSATQPNAIFYPQLEDRLRRIATSTANTKKNGAPFRHLLLHGPPGTGKTLFAKGLAQHSGLDYAIMTGGDVAPLGRDAVAEMHKLFDWANTSKRGVLIFVDEADAFLRRRSTEVISEDMRNALNAFLYRTGEQTDKFMVIYASNQPEQFDDAVNDRVDEMVAFENPARAERRRMLDSYMSRYLLGSHGNAAAIEVVGVEASHLDQVAAATDGFSGRELSKLAIAWQAAAYGSENCRFTPELMGEILDDFKEQKMVKMEWQEASNRELVLDGV